MSCLVTGVREKMMSSPYSTANRVVPDKALGAEHRMPQSARLLLPDERNVRHIGDGLQLLKLLGLAALFQPLVVFERVVEMVFNRFLVPPRDDEDVR